MSEFRYDVTEINQIIGSFLPDVRGFQTTVQKAMNEAVRNGGKRVRPIIMYETCRMFAEACGEEKDSGEACRPQGIPTEKPWAPWPGTD